MKLEHLILYKKIKYITDLLSIEKIKIDDNNYKKLHTQLDKLCKTVENMINDKIENDLILKENSFNDSYESKEEDDLYNHLK